MYREKLESGSEYLMIKVHLGEGIVLHYDNRLRRVLLRMFSLRSVSVMLCLALM